MPPKNTVIPHTHFRVAGADNYNYCLTAPVNICGRFCVIQCKYKEANF